MPRQNFRRKRPDEGYFQEAIPVSQVSIEEEPPEEEAQPDAVFAAPIPEKKAFFQRQPKAEKHQSPKQPKTPREFKRSFGDFFRSKIVLGLLSVVVAILIAFVALPIIQGMVSERVPVVTVTQNVEKGTMLTSELLTITEIGMIDRPKNAATAIDQAEGSFATYDMAQGDLVVSSKLSWERPLANPYLYDIPEGKMAMSVAVSGLAEGLSGKLKPGDIVSVYAIFQRNDVEQNYLALQPPELKYVKVLAMSNSGGHDIDVDDARPVIEGNTPANDNTKLPATITLLVDDFQAASLSGLSRGATVHVGLVARAADEALCESYLAEQEVLVEELKAAAEEAKEDEESSTIEVLDIEAPDTVAGDEAGATESGVSVSG